MNKGDDTIKKKISFFKQNNIRVHIKKKDGMFYNGIIIKEPDKGIYEFEDRKLGLIYIFLGEIEKLEEYRGEDNES